MALVKCPECGKEISDKAKRCIHCGKVFAEDKPQIKLCADCGKENPIDAAECIHCGYPFKDGIEKKNSFEMEEELNTPNSKAKSNKKIKIICITILAIIFISIVCAALFRLNNSLSINEINISKWKLTDKGDYFDDYEGIVNSDESNSFIAVLGYYEEKESDNIPLFVYMKNGKGVIQLTELAENGDDPSIKYTAIGYMNGRIIKKSDISNIEYNESDYNDWSDDTSCTVDIDIEMKRKMNGMLFMELKNDLTKDIERNVAVTIIDGKGEYSYYLSELPFKSRGVEVTAIPKFFCNATDIKENDFTIEKPFSVEKELSSFSGKEELSFDGYDDGMIIYSEELQDGGKKEERGEVKNKVAYLKNNRCTLKTYTSDYSDDKILTPTYHFKIAAYLKWNNYKK